MEFWQPFIVTINFISIMACLWFQNWNYKIPNKTLALKMIAILNFGNLLQHISGVLFYFFQNEDNLLLSIIDNLTIKFSILWPCNIAFLISESLKKNRISSSHQTKYFIITSIGFLLIAAGLTYL